MNNQPNQDTVLIVDDIPANISALSNFLRSIGFKVLIAKNGKSAIQRAEYAHPDLILMDVIMPEMNGFDACHILKSQETTKEIPIIFMTALTDTVDKVKGFELGAADYITKPIQPEEVLARVNVHLALKKALATLTILATTDAMTGVYNRRFAYEILAKQIATAKRENSSFVLCYIDVDNLKKINDTHGHKAGDTLINTIVSSLKKSIRTSDYIFRMGGDEFLLLFSNTKLQTSYALIKRLRKILNQQKIHDVLIDFSFGFSEYHAGDDIAIEALIKIADNEMYNVKMEKKRIIN